MLFHQIIRARRIQNQVYAIFDRDSVWKDSPGDVTKAFVDYYQQLLGTTCSNRKQVIAQIMQSGPVVNTEQQASLARDYTTEEITQVFFQFLEIKLQEQIDTELIFVRIHGELWGLMSLRLCWISLGVSGC